MGLALTAMLLFLWFLVDRTTPKHLRAQYEVDYWLS